MIAIRRLCGSFRCVRPAKPSTTTRWTDAFTPLVRYLQNSPSHVVYVTDWGILETVNLLSEGEVPVQDATAALPAMLADKNALFLTHAPAYEIWPAREQALREFAAPNGYRRELLMQVPDRNGRKIFEVSRYSSASK